MAMEPISSISRLVSERAKESSDKSQRKNDSSQKEWQNERPNNVYLAQIRRMIRRVIELANQAPLDDATVVSRAEAWADAMWGVIPEDRLLDSFTQAVRFHDTVYPINAHEVLLAWKEISESEAKLAEKHRFETIRDRALEAPQYEDCRYCHGCGFKPAKPKDGFPGVQLCYECAYWIRRDAERELNRNRKVAR